MSSINIKKKNKESLSGSAYWRSLDELADTPEFREFMRKEFPNNATELLDGGTRRQFLKVMAASLAMAGLTGCRWPKEKIVPYARRPENRNPGTPVQFATSMEINGVATGLLMTSYDGRPVKAEGNPLHPGSHGAASTFAQASILELYDPDRSQHVVDRRGNQSSNRQLQDFNDFARPHFNQLKEKNGKGLFILSERTNSITVEALRSRFFNVFPQARWIEYEPISDDNEREGTRIASGTPLRLHTHLDKAKIILSLDADPMGTHPNALAHSKEFVKNRDPEQDMNRLYAVESRYSTTGTLADHRLAIPSGQIEYFGACLCAEILHNSKMQIPAWVKPIQEALKPLSDNDFHKKFIQTLAEDLVANQGSSLIMAGTNQPESVHVITFFLNTLLGNTGKTLNYSEIKNQHAASHLKGIQELVKAIENNQVNTLLILGGNPAYNTPGDLAFADKLKKIQHTINLSLYENETAHLCKWHIPRKHFLESWGDARAFDGTISTIQPLIYPFYEGKSIQEFIAFILDYPQQDDHEITKEIFQQQLGDDNFERSWKKTLHEGILPKSHFGFITPDVKPEAIEGVFNRIPFKAPHYNSGNFEVVFYQDSKVYDGRFANNGWLQELPDFHTKVAWDNVALLSYSTANELGIKSGDLIQINGQDDVLEIPVYVMPGQADYSIALFLGYGRTAAGRVGNQVGFNTYAFRKSDSMYIRPNLTIEQTGKTYLLASTQDHYAIDLIGMRERQRRIGELIREATLDEFKDNPEFAHKGSHHKPIHLWNEHEYNNEKWGMAIDLNSCTGCNACVTACQAENNIPIVGKEQVINGREMHWIRVDRYFKGDPSKPEIAHQPVACVHCENAPCEQVCPVAATVHSDEGLNVMVYNRCIGTRYCSNNCPYKVRRFNYLYYHGNLSETEKMAFNPEVTVRSRGVMEKCTYCVQRIESVKIKAKNEGREIQDGEIIPACAQTCPTQAITFGNLNDKDSKVANRHADYRTYYMLEELHVKPRTAYLARIKNPNPKLVETQKANESKHHS